MESLLLHFCTMRKGQLVAQLQLFFFFFFQETPQNPKQTKNLQKAPYQTLLVEDI